MTPFWKYQAIGNHFPLFHLSDVDKAKLPELAKDATQEKFGIGGDGILVMEPVNRDGMKLQMFNPDGTEDFCGNGLRIAARHAYDQGWVGPAFTIQHFGREVKAEVSPDGQIKTTLGVADYTPSLVPVNRPAELFDDVIDTIDGQDWRGSSLSTGSTHTIIPVEELPGDAIFQKVGAEIENNKALFPERTSVIFTKVLGPNELKVRIWERGVGETQGCGSGSSAAAADYLRRQGHGGAVLVKNPGGDITISMDAWNTPITVQGTAELVYTGHFVR